MATTFNNSLSIHDQQSTKFLRLRRFLYLGNEDAIYKTGDPYTLRLYRRRKLNAVKEILTSSNVTVLLNQTMDAYNCGSFPRSETVLFVLVVALRCTRNLERRREIFATIKTICKSVVDMQQLINFYLDCGGQFGIGIKSAVNEFFLQKDALTLAIEITTTKYILEEWDLKDIINRIDFKSSSLSLATRVVFEYVTKGIESATAWAAKDPTLQEIIKRFHLIEQLKVCNSPDKASELITVLKCDINLVPSRFRRNPQVWAAAVRVLSIRKLLSVVPRLVRLDILESESLLENIISQYLVIEEHIKAFNIQPLEVLMVITHFVTEREKFHISKEVIEDDDEDFELPEFVTITNALYTMLDRVIKNQHPTNKRYMITVEVTDKMEDFCLTQRHIFCLEAAVIILASLLKIEPFVRVGIFNGNGINYLEISVSETLATMIDILNGHKSSYIVPAAAFESAIQQNISVDVFINLMSDFEWINTVPAHMRDLITLDTVGSFETYRNAMALHDAKLINFSLRSLKWRIGENHPGVLDVYGFDADIAILIKAFANDLFR